MRLALPLILIVQLLALPARADPEYDTCLSDSDASMADMGTCGDA